MEIRQVIRGTDTSFAATRPAQKAESRPVETTRPAADRLELSRQWVEQMEEQSAQIQALLSQPGGGDKEEKSEGILDMLDETSGESEELDALSQQMKIQMKCLEIAMRMMKGKKVPPEDERYLMENDPKGYKIAMAMKSFVKEDKKECKSVLDEEDKNGGASETSDSGESAPAETPSGGEGEAASTGGEE